MSSIRPFNCIRPDVKYVKQVAALPYDVYNRQEAKVEVEREPLSFLKIDRAETSFDDSVDTYAPEVYQKAKELLEQDIEAGIYVEDNDNAYYIYQLVMDGRSQTGLVACASVDDYINNRIKKHENTREDKEIDRITHVDTLSAQTGPIFLAYRSDETINEVVARNMEKDPLYDFVAVDGITHRVWKIDDSTDVEKIKKAFENIDKIYIADGHHRAASAVKVGLKRREENPGYTGDEEFNYFLSVLFPHDELMIMDYNRTVKDLNGLTLDEFLDKVGEKFSVEKSDSQVSPQEKGTFGMYVEGQWYLLRAKDELFAGKDAVGSLDVSVLQDNLLGPILGIGDPRTDSRIDFIGGIRGLSELEKRADGDMKISFSMYPTSITELFDVADNELLMPPKSTWFEPKLRSGLFIHRI
ncbi:DUF1015 domain-containing protein [Eubacterium xylanophilum]|uniref:DUF1015 domain-containing protein n=1 Tax=Eubacterium xylanophilum TaxID=39497 RepID=UPI000478932E|nr:DUF1015 family protein [Eubacterium xylanophilum]